MTRSFAATLLLAASALTASPGAALADITIGITISATGNGAALGIPMKNSVDLFPTEIGGEAVKLILLDDGGDPAAATTNARRLITDDRADVIIGSSLTPATIAIAGVAAETEVPHFACAPMPLDPAKYPYSFVLPQPAPIIAGALFEKMKADGVKTVGYIGFSDSYGDLWIDQLKKRGADYGIEVVAEERFARPDTSVSGQVLKLVAARPDAIFVGASGTGAALPQIGLRERGFQGTIYQTHGAVTFDFFRVAGAAAANTIFASGPVMVAEKQADSSLTKAPGLEYVTAYEAKFGEGKRTQFGAHIFDAVQVLKAAVPVALETAEPGTPEFRTALRDAIVSIGEVPASQGVYDYTETDHYGLDDRSVVLLSANEGQFELVE